MDRQTTSTSSSRPISARTYTSLPEATAKRVQCYVERNLSHHLTLRDLAALANLSPAYFCRTFKVTFGTTFRHYLIEQRIARACWLLIHTRRPLVCVAIECGMFDQPHFCNTFRKLRGMSPGRWRSHHQQEATRLVPHDRGTV